MLYLLRVDLNGNLARVGPYSNTDNLINAANLFFQKGFTHLYILYPNNEIHRILRTCYVTIEEKPIPTN